MLSTACWAVMDWKLKMRPPQRSTGIPRCLTLRGHVLGAKRPLLSSENRKQYFSKERVHDLAFSESICISGVVLLGDFSSVGIEAREVDEAHLVGDIAQGG